MSKLTDFCGLWKRTGKNGNTYFTGKVNGTEIIGFINNKQNDAGNRPYIRLYKKEDIKQDVGALWYHKRQTGKQAYMSGKIGETDVVAFVNKNATEENRQPAIRVYINAEEPQQPEKAPEKKAKAAPKADNTGDLPF